jgi:hypothetical protein
MACGARRFHSVIHGAEMIETEAIVYVRPLDTLPAKLSPC